MTYPKLLNRKVYVVVPLPSRVQLFAIHGLQHARLPYASPSSGVCPSSCSLHRWCCPVISSSGALLSFCPRSMPASGTFPMSHLFSSDDQNTGASASASVLSVSIQGWSPCCPRDFQDSSPAPQFEGINSLVLCLLYSPALTTVCDHWEDHSLDSTDLCQQNIVSLLFNILPRFVINFWPGRNCLLISWLQASSALILEPKKRKSVTTSTFSSSVFHAVMGPDVIILDFKIFSLKLALSLSSFTLIKRLFSSSLLPAIRVVSSTYLRLLIFLQPVLIPACNSSSLAFLMMCSVYRLNKQSLGT